MGVCCLRSQICQKHDIESSEVKGQNNNLDILESHSCSCFPPTLCPAAGSPRKQDPSDAPSPNTSQTQSSQHSSQSISSTTISLPLSARGQSTTTSQGLAHTTISGSGLNIQPVSTQTPRLQPPSFFKNSPSPPNSQSQDQNKTPPTSSAMAANYKQILNIHCQKNHIPVAYECSSSEDSVGYIAVVKVSGRVFESLPQGTKRAAESSAAEKAVKALGLAGPGQPVDHLHGSGPHQHGAGSHHVASSPATQSELIFSC